MRLAGIVSCRHPRGTDSARALAADLELVSAMKDSAADVLVLQHACSHGEHWNLNGISYAAYLADHAAPLGAVVRGLRLGISNPVELAEALGTLDHAWAGRFAAGLVVAGPEEFAAHAKDPDRAGTRFDEALTILATMWAGEPFSVDGEVYRFDEVRPTLLPHTVGGPPLSLSATDVRGAVLAGERGLGLHLPVSSLASSTVVLAAYREAGGTGDVSVEMAADDLVGPTAAELEQLGLAQIDLHLPAAGHGPDHMRTLTGLLDAAGAALGR